MTKSSWEKVAKVIPAKRHHIHDTQTKRKERMKEQQKVNEKNIEKSTWIATPEIWTLFLVSFPLVYEKVILPFEMYSSKSSSSSVMDSKRLVQSGQRFTNGSLSTIACTTISSILIVPVLGSM